MKGLVPVHGFRDRETRRAPAKQERDQNPDGARPPLLGPGGGTCLEASASTPGGGQSCSNTQGARVSPSWTRSSTRAKHVPKKRQV